MSRRQAAPWMMTDERAGDALWPALERLPRGATVVFRHRSLPPFDRRLLFDGVRAVTRRRGLRLLLAGSPREAVGWRADGTHGCSPHRRSSRPLVRSAPCHDRAELIAARRAGAAHRLVSPLFATRSHPDAAPLGSVRAGLMIGGERTGLIALGGMTARHYRSLRLLGFANWAAIDAWTG